MSDRRGVLQRAPIPVRWAGLGPGAGTTVRGARTSLTTAFAVIALFAIALRALVPAGYMIAPRAEDGAVVMALCSEHGTTQVRIDLRTGEVVADDAREDDHGTGQGDDPAAKKSSAPCVFATAAALAPPSFGPGVPVRVNAPAFEVSAVSHVAPGRGLAAPPPYSTGPPTQLI